MIDPAMQRALHVVKSVLNTNEQQHVYVVGGAIRDIILGKAAKDLDFVVDSVAGGLHANDIAERIVQRYPASNYDTNQYGVALVHAVMDGEKLPEIEIATARSESYGKGGYKPTEVLPATIDNDVVRREFTFNTLMVKVADIMPNGTIQNVIDLTGKGLDDLTAKNMRTPSDPVQTFTDDPSRIFRVFKFRKRGFVNMVPEVFAALKQTVGEIINVPDSHFGKLLIEMLETDTISQLEHVLSFADEIGMNAYVQAFLEASKPQSKGFFDNWIRVQNLDRILKLQEYGYDVSSAIGMLPQDIQAALPSLVHVPNILGYLKQPTKLVPRFTAQTVASTPKREVPAVMQELANKIRRVLVSHPELIGDEAGIVAAMD